MRLIDADALIEFCAERWIPLNIDAVNMQPTIQPEKTQLFKEGTTSVQPVATDTNVGDTISKFIDGLEEIFADLRERHVDDSVCGLCEYDGAYIGQSGDWCNECPGFDRDDCFKLSDETRKKWTDEIIKALPPAQPEPQWIPVSERLPEDTQYVLLTVRRLNNAYNSTPFISVGYIGWNQCHWWCAHDGDCEIGKVEVLAWMPLPEAYKPNK